MKFNLMDFDEDAFEHMQNQAKELEIAVKKLVSIAQYSSF